MNRFLWIAALSCVSFVAYGQDTRASLESSFSLMVSGRYVEAEAGFLGTTATTKEGSAERWISQEMSKLSRSLDEKKTKGLDATAFKAGFTLLLEGKALEAQVSFLQASAPFSDNNSNRAFGRTLSDLAASYGQQKFVATVEVSNPQTQNTNGTNLASPSATRPVFTPEPNNVQKNAGKFEVIIDGAVFGAFTTITGAVLAGLGDSPDDGPALTLVSVGGAAGGGIVGALYANAHKNPLTLEESSPISIGGALGVAQGGLAVALLGIIDGEEADAKQAVGTIWIGTAVGFTGGILTTELGNPSRGDPYLVASSALWGTALSLGILGIVQPTDGQSIVSTLTVGYDSGIAGGVVLASMFDTSTQRLKEINIYGGIGLLGGALTGAAVGSAFGGEENIKASLGVFSILTLVGGAGGVLYGFYQSADGKPAFTAAPRTPRLLFQGISPAVGQGREKPMLLNAAFKF
jgi:hypothetical protein